MINDYFVLVIERINQPGGRIPWNKGNRAKAFIFAMLLFLFGFILSLVLAVSEKNDLTTTILTPFLALLGIVFLYFYASYFKRTAGLGNLIVTILVCIPLLYGGTITNQYSQSIYPILVASTLMFGREIVKDVEDVKGDKEGASRDEKQITTLPMIFGIRKTALLSKIILIIFLVCSPVAFLTPDIQIYQSWFLFICIVIADILVLYSIINLRGSDEDLIKNATKSKRLLKSAIAVGVIGLLLASLTPFSQITSL